MTTQDKPETVKHWFKKNLGSSIVVTILLFSLGIINNKFDRMDDKLDKRFERFDDRLATVEKDVAAIKMALMIKNILPPDCMAKKEGK